MYMDSRTALVASVERDAQCRTSSFNRKGSLVSGNDKLPKSREWLLVAEPGTPRRSCRGTIAAVEAIEPRIVLLLAVFAVPVRMRYAGISWIGPVHEAGANYRQSWRAATGLSLFSGGMSEMRCRTLGQAFFAGPQTTSETNLATSA